MDTWQIKYIDDIFPVKAKILVSHVHPQILSGIFFS